MNDHEIKQAICALIAMSAVFAVAMALGVWYAEGSELLSWNSWLEYFCSWSG